MRMAKPSARILSVRRMFRLPPKRLPRCRRRRFCPLEVEDFSVSRLVSFTLGETHVAGSWQAHHRHNQCDLRPCRIDLLDFLTVDKIVARVSGSTWPMANTGKVHIIALGSHFDNLRLGGFEVKVTLRHDLLPKSTKFPGIDE